VKAVTFPPEPLNISPAVDLAIQSALVLVPEGQRRAFRDDLESLVVALAEGRDNDAQAIVERYVLGANFGTLIVRYRERAIHGHR